MNSIRNGLGMGKRRSRGNQADRGIRISMRFSPKFITRFSPSLWRSLASLMRSNESSGIEILPACRRCGMEYSLK